MHKYDWAVNPTKLTQSILALEAKKKTDSRIVIDEESIKLEYVARGGLLVKYKPAVINNKVVFADQPSIKEQTEEIKAEEKAEADQADEDTATPSAPTENPKSKKTKKDKAE